MVNQNPDTIWGGGKASLCNHSNHFSLTTSKYFPFTVLSLLVPKKTWHMNKSLWVGMPVTLMTKVRIGNIRSHKMVLVQNQ